MREKVAENYHALWEKEWVKTDFGREVRRLENAAGS